MEKTFNVLILDDNPAFLMGYHDKIVRHASSLELLWDCKMDIQAFSKTSRFFQEVSKDVDLLILDYKLGTGLNANILLHVLKKSGVEPATIIMSDSKPQLSKFNGVEQHISAILRKDTLLIPRTCTLLEKHLFSELNDQK